MPVLIPFLLLFVMLGLLWVIAVAVLVGALIFRAPRALEKIFGHGEEHCACYLGLKHHHSA